MNDGRFIGILAGLGISAVALALGSIAGVDYDLSWHTIDSGGGTSTGANYELTATIGQPDAGPALAGDSFELIGGFWHAPAPQPAPACLADIAPAQGDGIVNVDDLLLVINQWGAGPSEADIAPSGGNGLVNTDDLLAVVNAWGVCP